MARSFPGRGLCHSDHHCCQALLERRVGLGLAVLWPPVALQHVEGEFSAPTQAWSVNIMLERESHVSGCPWLLQAATSSTGSPLPPRLFLSLWPQVPRGMWATALGTQRPRVVSSAWRRLLSALCSLAHSSLSLALPSLSFFS